MARHRVHSSVELAQLLNPSKMATVYDVDLAVEEFNALLNPRNYLSVFEGVIKERIGSIPALILSTLGEKPSLFHWFSESIPETNIMALSNILSKVIIELSNFFIDHPLAPSIPEQTIAMIHEYRRIANHAPHLLQGLFALTTVAEDPKAHLVSSSTMVKAKIPRSATKTALRTFVDDEAERFHAFEMPIPTNVNQVEAVISTLRQRLCDILEFYKPIFCLPEFIQTIKSHIADNAAHASATTNPTSGTNMTSDDHILEPVSAFPSVQPLKSAMYFENAEGFGNWKLLISSRADSDLRACSRKDRASFKIVVRKLKSLSHGHFSADNQRTLAHSAKGVPIYEAKMTGDTRMVYHVDLLEEEEEVSSYTHQTTMNNSDMVRQILTQVLKIIGVMYTHAHIDNTNWDAISRQLGRRGKEYRKYCTTRGSPLRHGNDTCPPATVSKACVDNDAQGATQMEALELPPDDLEQLHTLIGQDKYVEFSKQLLFNMLAGLDDEFPFTVSTKWHRQNDHHFYKMVTVERSFQLSPQDLVKPRQLFVTCSRVLVKKVEKRFKELMDALKTTQLSPEELKQLAISRASAQVELVDEENRTEWRSDLPTRFSELEDKHFPLFIAYDDICTMLEADLLPSARRQSRLDYNRFRREYWEHLPQNLRKSLDPSLVFSEIIGAICGSEQTLHTPNGYLDLQAYQNLSGRTHSTFAEKRVQLHSVFLEVLKKKRQLQDRHAAERTHDLLRAFRDYDRLVPKVHYLYIDEVQDHLLIDAKREQYLCYL
ncbi:hypothetical protein NLJ89_g1627 [Agrocybe chaxingu]|uniref:Uncharacterized protein n=1 Tax=Agrocybe chaxingu TaxID=84603 RepID=A0A9W8TD26_9AGAR|nr:hypothetical protein NLJ89_g1627 [Agrocybe chaxingu]